MFSVNYGCRHFTFILIVCSVCRFVEVEAEIGTVLSHPPGSSDGETPDPATVHALTTSHAERGELEKSNEKSGRDVLLKNDEKTYTPTTAESDIKGDIRTGVTFNTELDILNDTEVDTETDILNDAKSDNETDNDTKIDAKNDTQNHTKSDNETDNDTKIDAKNDTQNHTKSDNETDNNTKIDAKNDTQNHIKSDNETDNDTKIDAKNDTQNYTKNVNETDNDTKMDAKNDTQNHTKSDNETDNDTKIDAKNDTQNHPKSDSETDNNTKIDAKNDRQNYNNSDTETDTKNDTNINSKTDHENSTKTDAEVDISNDIKTDIINICDVTEDKRDIEAMDFTPALVNSKNATDRASCSKCSWERPERETTCIRKEKGRIQWEETKEGCFCILQVSWQLKPADQNQGLVFHFTHFNFQWYESLEVYEGNRRTTDKLLLRTPHLTTAVFLAPHREVSIWVKALRRPFPTTGDSPSSFSLNYSTHPLQLMPVAVTSPTVFFRARTAPLAAESYMYNCSAPYTVPEYILCDMVQQCLGGEDEPAGCPYKSVQCGNDWFPFKTKCLKIFKTGKVTGPTRTPCGTDTNSKLMTLPEPAERKIVGEILSRTGIGQLCLAVNMSNDITLQRSTPQLELLYRYAWQWETDGAMNHGDVPLQRAGASKTTPLGFLFLFNGEVFTKPYFVYGCGNNLCMKSGNDSEKKKNRFPVRLSLDSNTNVGNVNVELPTNLAIPPHSLKRCSDGSFVLIFQQCRPTDGKVAWSPTNFRLFDCVLFGQIHYSLVCDGIADCRDKSDERGCAVPGKVDVGREFFVCVSDDQIIPARKRCDGSSDCFDRSDELPCSSCVEGRIPCGRHGCVPSHYAPFLDCVPHGKSTEEEAQDLTNVALRKPAEQSYPVNSKIASRAVDGDDNPIFQGRSCAHTGSNYNSERWWRVDLEGFFVVHTVVITNRGDCCGRRLRNFTVVVDTNVLDRWRGFQEKSAECVHQDAPVADGATVRFNCHQPIYGRYVTVVLLADTYLTLCEVKVFAVPATGMVLTNVALNKLTSQSRVFKPDYNLSTSERAVDGDKNTIFGAGAYVHTRAEGDSYPWWRVDLEGFYVVEEIVITNRGDGGRLTNFTIDVSRDLSNPSRSSQATSLQCLHHKGGLNQGATVHLECLQPIVGRYVTVVLYSNTQPLHLREFEVLASPASGVDGCESKLVDLVIVLHASSNLYPVNYIYLKRQLVWFLSGLDISSGRVRVGLVVFSSQAHVQFTLQAMTHRSFAKVLNTPHYHGSTNTSAALKLARTQMFHPRNETGPGVLKLLLLITDESSNINSSNTVPEAFTAKHQEGIHIITVGYGARDLEKELNDISSPPASKNVFIVSSFADVIRPLSGIAAALCPKQRLPVHIVELEDCYDKFYIPKCQYWASLGECLNNLKWMTSNCKKSCNKCDSEEALRNETVEPQVFQPMKYIYPPAVLYLDTFGMSSLEKMEYGQDRCPATHFQCPQGFCIPTYLLNNGIWDCPLGQDEDITNLTCPGFYRCRQTGSCLHPDLLCDGINHCPFLDDERYCKVEDCPTGCVCEGQAFKCQSDFSMLDFRFRLRYLDLSGTEKPTLNDTEKMVYLRFMNLSSCSLTDVSLYSMAQLQILDLSHNNITGWESLNLLSLQQLEQLNVSFNPLAKTLDQAFTDFLKRASMLKLQTLKMVNIGLHWITSNRLVDVPLLSVLDIRLNPVDVYETNVFGGSLEEMYTDNPRLCCHHFHSSPLTACYAPVDELSSCSDLLKSDLLRFLLWTLSVVALTGNVGVLIYRCCFEQQGTSLAYRVLVLNLSTADFLMGVYMALIGGADVFFRGVYVLKEENWRNSAVCKAAGFLAMVSSEVSAIVICLITLDRLCLLYFPFNKRLHMSRLSALLACGFAWMVGIVMASVPLSQPHWMFYSQNGICLPLPITQRQFLGRQYAFGIFIVFNFILFLFIGAGQGIIFHTIHRSARAAKKNIRKQDIAVARNLFLIVFTDFCCWFPVGLMGLLAAQGTPISDVVNVWAAVFVLPLNSAVNPFLYTLNALMEKRAKSRERKLREKLTNNILAEMRSCPHDRIEELLHHCRHHKLVKTVEEADTDAPGDMLKGEGKVAINMIVFPGASVTESCQL